MNTKTGFVWVDYVWETLISSWSLFVSISIINKLCLGVLKFAVNKSPLVSHVERRSVDYVGYDSCDRAWLILYPFAEMTNLIFIVGTWWYVSIIGQVSYAHILDGHSMNFYVQDTLCTIMRIVYMYVIILNFIFGTKIVRKHISV